MNTLKYDISSFKRLSVLGLATCVQPLEDLPRKLEAVAANGYEYVYFSDLFHDSTYEHVRERGGFCVLRRMIKEAGLKINSSHHLLMYPGPGDTLERIKATHLRCLDVAAEVGLRYMTTHYISITNVEKLVDPEVVAAYQYNPLLGAPALWEEAMMKLGGRDVFLEKNNEMYRWFCDEAAPRGITPTIETAICHLTRTPAQIIEIIKEIDRPNLGICLDSGHSHIVGVNVAESVRQSGRYLVETHFHDNFGCLDLHRPIGIGTINWPEVILALREINFPGPITFETNTAPHNSLSEEAQLYAHNWLDLLKTTAYREARNKAFTGGITW